MVRPTHSVTIDHETEVKSCLHDAVQCCVTKQWAAAEESEDGVFISAVDGDVFAVVINNQVHTAGRRVDGEWGEVWMECSS